MTDESRDLAALAQTPDAVGTVGPYWDATDDANADAPGRFAGDEGTWEPAFRDAVVHLYKRRFISKAQHSQHWEPLVRNLPLVRADLNNHNLTLVIDTTREVMFKKQAPIEDGAPTLLRDVSYSLGATRWKMVTTAVLPSALPGIVTGVILSFGRAVSETAAVIFTAGTALNVPTSLFSPVRTMAVHFYILAVEGISLEKAYATGAVLIITVLLINVAASALITRLVRQQVRR